MDDSNREPAQEEVEERLVSDEIEEAATGRRWRFCLAMIGLGIVGVVIGAKYGPRLLIICGVLVILGFGWIAAGGTFVDVAGPGGIRGKAFLPRRMKRRTMVRKSGFPKKGRSPIDRDDGSPSR